MKTEIETIKVNGVDYVRADSVPKEPQPFPPWAEDLKERLKALDLLTAELASTSSAHTHEINHLAARLEALEAWRETRPGDRVMWMRRIHGSDNAWLKCSPDDDGAVRFWKDG